MHSLTNNNDLTKVHMIIFERARKTSDAWVPLPQAAGFAISKLLLDSSLLRFAILT